MAVADGHGSKRYWLSDVGSRLGCELAITLAAKDLAQQCLRDPSPNHLEGIHTWLAKDLPAQLVPAWGKAIEADWQQRELPEAHRGESFASQTYGTTLALVVMTPNWWAHTGLGDWDLVQLNNQHPDKIVSQECNLALQGEATESLCLPYARDCFEARTAVYPLVSDRNQGFGLVLSTDGIRKSCATDNDYLALSRYLMEEAQRYQAKTTGDATRLDLSLDRISREGSGDDVSVAVAYFGKLNTLTNEEIQPDSIAKAEIQWPPMPPLPSTEIELKRSKNAHTDYQSQRPREARTSIKRPITSWAAVLIIVTSIGATWLLSESRITLPEPKRDRSIAKVKLRPSQRNHLNQEIQKLCSSNPSQIQTALRQHKENKKAAGNGNWSINQALANKDWIGSLILISKLENNAGIQLTELCPELKRALAGESRIEPSQPSKEEGKATFP